MLILYQRHLIMSRAEDLDVGTASLRNLLRRGSNRIKRFCYSVEYAGLSSERIVTTIH